MEVLNIKLPDGAPGRFYSLRKKRYNYFMLKITGNDIWRSGEKIGWIEGNRIRARDGKKLGYFEGNFIYGEDGWKVAYVEGDHLFSDGGNVKVPLEKISEEIEGGMLPETGKCAIYVLLGD